MEMETEMPMEMQTGMKLEMKMPIGDDGVGDFFFVHCDSL